MEYWILPTPRYAPNKKVRCTYDRVPKPWRITGIELRANNDRQRSVTYRIEPWVSTGEWIHDRPSIVSEEVLEPWRENNVMDFT